MPSPTRDAFDTARSASAAAMVAAGAAAIIGTMLDWVTVTPPQIVPLSQADRTEPFTGWETGHGIYIVGAAAIVIVCAVLLVVRRRSFYAWGAFLASIVVGGIGISNYRGLDSLFYEQMDRIGRASPALGITLVAAGGIVGVIAAAAGVAASPSTRTTPTT
ncbi:MAG TPA: hypothetical protein VFK89_09380 [Actinomycetota bacterium]|nr:hypothetical protein [Actinomycetota bacterium]